MSVRFQAPGKVRHGDAARSLRIEITAVLMADRAFSRGVHAFTFISADAAAPPFDFVEITAVLVADRAFSRGLHAFTFIFADAAAPAFDFIEITAVLVAERAFCRRLLTFIDISADPALPFSRFISRLRDFFITRPDLSCVFPGCPIGSCINAQQAAAVRIMGVEKSFCFFA